MTTLQPSSLSGPSADRPSARTEAALGRLRKAMCEIEKDIETHHGVYPFNHGRVTQSELCRRADVKKATLQNTVHKDTTRVEIMAWLDQLATRLSRTRDGTRERVTAVADHLTAEIEGLTLACHAAQQRLAQAEERIAQLQDELAGLRAGLQASGQGGGTDGV